MFKTLRLLGSQVCLCAHSSVRLHVTNNSNTAQRIFMKCYLEEFLKICHTFQLLLLLDNNKGHVT